MNNRAAPLRLTADAIRGQPAAGVTRALRLYQQRAEAGDANPLAGTGSFLSLDTRLLGDETEVPLVQPVANPDSYLELPESLSLPSGSYPVRFLLTRSEQESRLADLLDAAEPSRDREEGLALLALLRGVRGNVLREFTSVMMTGTLPLENAGLRNLIREQQGQLAGWQTLVPDYALSLLQQLRPSLWPLRPGTAFRRLGSEGVLVDLVGATRGLFDRVAATTRPKHETKRFSDTFELDLQAAFDGSSWRTDPEFVRRHRGVQLKLRGKVITDLDAIGVRDGVLLVVDAKAWSRRPGLDTGTFAELRNIMRDTTNKLDAWDSKVEQIQRSPTGDNYDFSSFSRIVGVLCLPFLPLVDEATSSVEERLPGLRAVCSADELRTWLLRE